MATAHNLGFPRIGAARELKFALESFWKATTGRQELLASGASLRARSWSLQSGLGLVPVGDFSYYDHVLDTSFLLGNVPKRARTSGDALDQYFRVARGRSASPDSGAARAGEMTKWFDTNYHYIVPEFDRATTFKPDATRLIEVVREARAAGVRAKPVLVGPLTYLWLGKATDGSDRLELLPGLLPAYVTVLQALAAEGVEWVQLDEPILALDLPPAWQGAFHTAYDALAGKVRILLATYFGELRENLAIAAALPVDGLHVDAVRARGEVEGVLRVLPPQRILSLGVIDGRNVWKTDLQATLDWLEPIHAELGDRLWIAPSCSLLHVPMSLEPETALEPQVRSWLAFAVEKLEELRLLVQALNDGRQSVREALDANAAALSARRGSRRVHDPRVSAAVSRIDASLGRRESPYAARAARQSEHLRLPAFPTTTIGSFPQTQTLRKARSDLRAGTIDEEAYEGIMRAEIERCVREQEALGLDVLVHGEAERNDMVEHFAGLLDGFAITRQGWVQSYGSRCVKPPILYGDVSRPRPMTVEWIRYAQSLTTKPMKGMLTGPVTMLNWAFVRDDQPRSLSCQQIALAIREEVRDLESAGIRVIQIDEAALREGLPLRTADWDEYLGWAVGAFRVAANGVADETQIHTHMCYSEFNDIVASIASMDADVITIETSRSDMELLRAFDDFRYPNQIGPGVYDIHSPNVPTQAEIVQRMRKAAERIPAERLWVNPDCGLKTRAWEDVIPALRNMVAAARELRETPPR